MRKFCFNYAYLLSIILHCGDKKMRAIKQRKTVSMISGSPLKHIILFAIPLLIGNIFQQIYSAVDTMIAGRSIGDDAIAAIGSTSSLYSLIFNFAIGLNMGYGIVISQAFGANDENKYKKAIATSFVLNIIMTILLTTITITFLKPFMHFLNTPDDIFNQAYSYMIIICIGITCTVAYNMFACILRAVGNSKTPLYCLIISSIVNVILDILFMGVFKWGVAGAAIATVISQTVSALICGILVFTRYKEILPSKEDFKIKKSILTSLISIGLSMALMYTIVDIGSIIFQRANNELGQDIISAHTASRRLIGILCQPLGTIGSAFSTFTGQNYGAGKYDRIKKSLMQVFIIEIAWSLFVMFIVFVAGGWIVQFITGSKNKEIIDNGLLSLKWHVSFFIPLGLLCCLRTGMQAMGRKFAPLLSSGVECGLKLVSAKLFIPKYGFIATCMTEPIIWTCMFIVLLVAYLLLKKKMFLNDKDTKALS